MFSEDAVAMFYNLGCFLLLLSLHERVPEEKTLAALDARGGSIDFLRFPLMDVYTPAQLLTSF